MAVRSAVALVLGISAFLAALTAFHTYPCYDDGKILGYAWRLIQGEIPYRDFIYIRPPLSPYLACLWFVFPEKWVFTAGRIGHFFWMAVAQTALIWALRVNLSSYRVALLMAFWLWGMHHFFPMPWHTVDGVWCGTVGLALLFASHYSTTSFRSVVLVAMSGVFLSLAALAKQNFALVPVTIGLLAVGHAAFTKKPGAVLTLLAGGLVVPILFASYLHGHGALALAKMQWASASGKDGLYDLTLLLKLLGPRHPADAVGIIAGLGCLVARNSPWARLIPPALLFILGVAYPFLGRDCSFALFWFSVILFGDLVYSAIRKRRSANLADVFPCLQFSAGALALCIAAHISIGYPWPILGLAPCGGLTLFWMDRQATQDSSQNFFHRAHRIARNFAWGCCAVLLAVFSHAYTKEFLQAALRHETFPLHSLFPNFGRLYVDKPTWYRFQTLKTLRDEVPADKKVVVIPEYPIWSFLNRAPSPLPIDWVQPMEYRTFGKRIIGALDTKVSFVILQTDTPGRCVKPIRGGEVEQWVLSNWRPVRTLGDFCLYSRDSLESTFRVETIPSP